MYNQQAPFFTQLGILTKRLLLRVIRRPLSELPNLFISAFFLFIYDGALGRVFGSSAVGTSLDFAQGNFVNFILPVSIISASLSGSASGFYIIEDYRLPNFFKHLNDANETKIDKLINFIKKRKYFKSKILNKSYQNIFFNEIVTIKKYHGLSKISDIVFFKKR